MASARAALAALDAAVPRDVVLFRHDRARFFRLVGLLCAGQGLLWGYLARLALAEPPGPADGNGNGGDGPARPRDKWRRWGLGGSCLALGSLVAVAGAVLPLRSVRELTLLRGGRRVAVRTHGALGLGRGARFTVPLRDVACRLPRAGTAAGTAAATGTGAATSAAALPLRVRGRPFHFVLERGGSLPQPRLFDLTVGARRQL